MKKKLINTLVLPIMCLSIFGTALANQASKITPQEAIKSSLRGTKITSIKKTPIKGLYEIIAGHNVFYSGKNGRYLVFGHIYDLKTQTDITASVQQDIQQKPVIKWSSLPKESAIIQNKNAKMKLAVFIDPDCPYCRALETVLSKLKNVKIYYYLYPLAELHPNSPYQSEQIWCSKNRVETLKSIMSGKPFDLKPNCDVYALKAIQKFGKDNQLNMTPTLIRSDGQVTYGYLDKDRLISWLKKENTKAR